MSADARAAALIAVVAVIAAIAPRGGLAAAPATLEVVGQSALGGRGMNAALAVAGSCAYVGSRNDASPQVVDVSDPAAPRVVGQLTSHRGSTPRELRAVASLRELAVLFYNLNGGPNRFDLYRWGADCHAPGLVGTYDFGGATPHEFYLWQDPARPSRVLLFATMFGSGGSDLNVIDVSDPAKPVRIGGWTAPSSYGSAKLHSIALSNDGRTAYLSLWYGGLAIADSSDFAAGSAQPALRLLTPASAVYRTSPGNVHSAVPVPGRALLLTTDERYPSPYGQGCPYGTAHVVDVSNPARPSALGLLSIPENDPSRCASVRSSTWTSHNPTLTANLALVTWYSGGLQVFGLDDPSSPQRLVEFRPSGVAPTLRDVQLGPSDSMTWSYPVISDGLIYVVDINQGLTVLRYHGPHESEIAGVKFAEGNSNLQSNQAAPTPSSSPAPSATPSVPGGQPRAVAHPGLTLGPVLVAAAALLIVVAVAVLLRRRAGSGRSL